MSEYAAYFSYTIIQISRYSNMLQMCRALCKCVPRFKREREDRNFNVKYFEREVIFSIINLECEVALKVSKVSSLLKGRIEGG